MADAKAETQAPGHWQSQDAARPAIASQQVLEVIQLKTDAGTFDQAALGAYASGWQCAHKVASACKQAEASVPYITIGSPVASSQDALLADMNDISDAALRTDASNLVDQVTRRRTRQAFPRKRSS